MKIIKAVESDCPSIDAAIKEEFPYVEFSQQKISEKMSSPNFFIIKAMQGNIFAGFAELEFFFTQKEARLNAVWVDTSFRNQGFATQMVERLLHECRHKHLQRVFLLVKEGNSIGKALYSKAGFAFEKPHEKVLDGSKVAVWEKEL